jgi:hypothetical protein
LTEGFEKKVLTREGSIQCSNTIVFVILTVGASLRVRQKKALAPQVKWPVLVALCVSTTMVLIRNGYRIVELSDGWKGQLMRTERYLIGLDMVPMAIGVWVFVIFPPSFFLAEDKKLSSSMETLEYLDLTSYILNMLALYGNQVLERGNIFSFP